MNKKIIFTAFFLVLVVLILFSNCKSLSKFIFVNEYNSESNPGGRVAFGTLNMSGTDDTSSWYFDRDASGQYYFEFKYYVRAGSAPTGNLMANVASNMMNSIILNSITLKINNGGAITLTGSPAPNQPNTFRFPVSTSISNQLLNCNSFTLQAVGQGIHTRHQEPFDVVSRGIADVKRFINYWNSGGSPINAASTNTETPRVNRQTRENQTRENNDRNNREPNFVAYDQIVLKSGGMFYATIIEETNSIIRYKYPEKYGDMVFFLHKSGIQSIKYDNRRNQQEE